MKDNASHDKDPGYIFFNLKLAYDKYDAAKILKGPKERGYFAGRVRMFLKMIDELNLPMSDEAARLVKYAKEAMAKEGPGNMEDFKSNPMDIPGNAELPPYEPFKTHQGGVFGEKQTRMYRLVTMKHALKIEKLGMRVSRGVNVTQMVKKEFGLKGSRDKIIAQFEALLPDILEGRKPLPGWKEEPYAWMKNRPPNPDAGTAHQHPFGTMQNNPSEPTYEPDPFRKDDEPQQPQPTEYDQTFQRLFGLARSWRIANESGIQQVEDKILSDIRYFIQYIESNGLHAPEGLERKYHKIRNFFLIGNSFSNNPGHGGSRPGAGRRATYHGDRPFLVQSRYIQPVRFRTMNAAVIFAREKASALKAQGKRDEVTVTSPQLGLIAKYVTMGPVFEQRVRHDPRQGPGSGAPSGGGLIRHKKEFEENPWLVAGPQVNILPEGPGGVPSQVTPSSVRQEEPEGVEEGAETLPIKKLGMLGGEAPVGSVIPVEGRAHREFSATQHKVRSRIAKHQRRNKHGRFYDNGRSQEAWDGQFIKVYEFSKRGLDFCGWFKFDSSRQIVTVRATEIKDGKSRGYEIDILADDQDAAHIYKMLRKKGFKYVVGKLKKKPFATRAYEKDLHVTQPTSGYASADTSPSAGGIPFIEGNQTTDGEIVEYANGLYNQIQHEVAENDFPQAVTLLLKLRSYMKNNMSRSDALWALEMIWDKSYGMVNGRWPNAIKRFRENRARV